jgi:hypothetical protein
VKLSDFGFNEYSQFGEDGMIDEALKRIGVRSSRCVEFGAGDGLSCSNTANLWHNGWKAVLVEASSELAQRRSSMSKSPLTASARLTTCSTD